MARSSVVTSNWNAEVFYKALHGQNRSNRLREHAALTQESYDIVAVQREREVRPLDSAISALGHIEDSRSPTDCRLPLTPE